MEHEDRELIARAQADKAAFEAVYLKYTGPVYNYFWYRVGHDKEEAEDLMQETFLRAFEHLPKFAFRGPSYRTYLFTIAHNLLVNYYRRAKPVPLEEAERIPVEIIERVEQHVDAERVWQAVQDLHPTEKEVVLLRYREDMATRDIARITGKSENAVKLLLSRARKKLRRHPGILALVLLPDIPKRYTRPRFLDKRR